MGIPRLTSYIAPYTVTTILGCDKPGFQQHSSSITSRSNKVIIDGPAFAYSINDRLTAHKADHLGAVAAIPTYDEVGQAALAVLSQLEKCGVIMYDQDPIVRGSTDGLVQTAKRFSLMAFYRLTK
jgi:hypothetical protein